MAETATKEVHQPTIKVVDRCLIFIDKRGIHSVGLPRIERLNQAGNKAVKTKANGTKN